MIYITAMRVRSPSGGLGINIYLHLLKGKVPGKFWTVSHNPGPELKQVSWEEVPSTGNSVEAFLDLVLDNEDYSRELLERVFDHLSREIESMGGGRNPLTTTVKDGSRAVFIVFSVNIGLESLASKRRVLMGLHEKVSRWLNRYDAQISRAIGGLADAV
jgi:hypothetical protein